MLQLKIVSPEKVEYDGVVENVLVPGTMGQFEIQHTIKIAGGFVAVQKNQVSLCVELHEHD